MNKIGLLVFLLVAFIPFTAIFGFQFDPSKAHYLWPTEASKLASATFGETRAAHFHAALDIKTWGRRGYKVFATRKGVLHRIAISPNGYGKVIYLKHEDGSFSLYAHLDDFVEPVAQFVDSLRLAQHISKIDTTFSNPPFRFSQGEMIAFTGSSGIGPPHLHFELRTPTEKPFNPLLTNIRIKDSRAPRISELSIEPLGKHSSVQGKIQIYRRKPRWNGKRFDFGTIEVSGTVGLGVDVFDQADGAANVYAAYSLSLYENGKLLYTSTADSFSYGRTGQMFIDRVFPLLNETGKGFQRLYKRDGNTLGFSTGNGMLAQRKGEHLYLIEVQDFYGNTTEAELKLRFVEPSKVNVVPNYHSFFADESWLGANAPFQITDRIDGEFPIGHSFSEQNLVLLSDYFLPHIKYDADSREIELTPLLPQKGSAVMLANGRAELSIPAGAVYDTLWVETQFSFENEGASFSILPDNAPFANDFYLRVFFPDSIQADRMLIYHKRKKDGRLTARKWSSSNQVFTAILNDFGSYIMATDTLPPVLFNPKIFTGRFGDIRIAVQVTEDESGIDSEQIRFYCNGVLGIAEFEPDRKRIVYRHPTYRPNRVTDIEVLVRDKAGNQTSYRVRF